MISKVLFRDGPATEATYRISGREKWVRVEFARNSESKPISLSQPFLVSRIGGATLDSAKGTDSAFLSDPFQPSTIAEETHDRRVLWVVDARLYTAQDSSARVSLRSLTPVERPRIPPDAGYIGEPYYAFVPNEEVVPVDRLSISYHDLLPSHVEPEHLRIFKYSFTELRWEPLPSEVSIPDSVVRAELDGSGIYALSAEYRANTRPPEVTTRQLRGDRLQIGVDLSELNNVVAVDYLLDGKHFRTDNDPYTNPRFTLPTQTISSGFHQLTVVLFDLSGKRISYARSLTIDNNVPDVRIDAELSRTDQPDIWIIRGDTDLWPDGTEDDEGKELHGPVLKTIVGYIEGDNEEAPLLQITPDAQGSFSEEVVLPFDRFDFTLKGTDGEWNSAHQMFRVCGQGDEAAAALSPNRSFGWKSITELIDTSLGLSRCA